MFSGIGDAGCEPFVFAELIVSWASLRDWCIGDGRTAGRWIDQNVTELSPVRLVALFFSETIPVLAAKCLVVSGQTPMIGDSTSGRFDVWLGACMSPTGQLGKKDSNKS